MNDLAARLRAQFEKQYEVRPDGCRFWTGTISNVGYGTMNVLGGYVLAHRLSYELFVGEIPDGLVIDHQCDNRACVNFKHFKPATYQENILRGKGVAAQNAQKTHCPKGHPYSGDNLRVCGGKRQCRACSIESQRLGRRRRGVPERTSDPPSAGALKQRRYRERQKQLLATA